MCDTCTIAEKIEAYGVPGELLDELAGKISETVQDQVIKRLTEVHDLMVATIMEQDGVRELRLSGPKVRETSAKMGTGRLVLKGDETANGEEFVYTLTEDFSKPEHHRQEDEFEALFRTLFED